MIIRRIILFVFVLFNFSGQGQSLEEKLEALSKEYAITFEALPVDTFFTEKYVLQVEQLVDHKKPDGPTFKQRVILSHLDFDAPMVFITEGYAANYALNPRYINELSSFLSTNQVCVEHRYFGTSIPEPLDWNYLTIANAAADHHHVVEILKNIYSESWINTGISKGGQTTIYHRYFYPDDVDISIPYVAPLNFSKEDRRVYHFLDTVATKECRENVFEFQAELLSNKIRYLPEFVKLAEKDSLTYRMDIEKVFELIVFEYSFAFFQWGQFDCESIPEVGTNDSLIVDHLNRVAGIDWVSDQGIESFQPFFYQAMREIGFYGYDIDPFKEWTSFAENPTFEFTLPEGVEVTYDPEPMRQVDHFIRHHAEYMLFIYGEWDPWSAPAVDLTRNTNSIKVIKAGGSHRTRIRNLPEKQKEFVLTTLKGWLEE